MPISPLAGQPAPASMRVDVPRLVTEYHAQLPEPSVARQRVQFGTSGQVDLERGQTLVLEKLASFHTSRDRDRGGVSGPCLLG